MANNTEVKPEEVVKVNNVECKTFREMILYKMDRTLAIAGLVLIAVWAINTKKPISSTAAQIVTLIGGGLITYIGGKIAK